ncbi:MAG: cellulase family glycosylhydrolase [Alphaproteobacteria bacterium]|nr:cellulase family glycosylhydrolase [Alphaproteobacteria bacterium]
MPLPRIRAEGERFVDTHGRTVLLRGVNLGGDCKVPWPDGGTHHPGSLDGPISFINRPFPLEQAEEHLGRLKRWGVRCLRLLTTWEAIAHPGPDQLDAAYLDYLTALCERVGEAGLYLFVDLHQDVFSRFTGGDGAPAWALEALGFDLGAVDACGAAWTMQRRFDPEDPQARQPGYPAMCWTWNYGLAANGVAWSLFFAGDRLAPGFQVEGTDARRFLQGGFLRAVDAVAARLADMPWVLGFDALNEPSRGWIGRAMSARPVKDGPDAIARPGPAASPLDALAAASGLDVRVPMLDVKLLRAGVAPVGEHALNPTGARLWRPGAEDPFRHAGAWDVVDGQPRALREDFFQRTAEGPLDFERDALAPFFARVAETIRRHRSDWLLFAEKDAVDAVLDPAFAAPLPEQTVNATHCYDVLTLLLKRSLYPVGVDPVSRRPVFGQGGIRDANIRQYAGIRAGWGRRPALIGEFGVPFDLAGGRSFRRWARGQRGPEVWTDQARVLRLSYDALDALLMSGTLWNYTATNRNDARIGDGWNQEDLSIFSPDQVDDPADADAGGRALDGWVRPWAWFIQGVPVAMAWDHRGGRFRLVFEADPDIPAPTVIVLPPRCFPDGPRVRCEGGRHQLDGDTLTLHAERAGPLTVTVTRG